MKRLLDRTRKARLVLALCLIAAGFAVPTANAGTFVPFNCWDGVTEMGVWSNYEYDCATVDVGNETEMAMPAEAQPRVIYDRVCRTHHRQEGTGQTHRRTFCIAVNQKQWGTCLCSELEALLSWDHTPYNATDVRVYINWIRLINSENGNVLKFKNGQGWFTCFGHGADCSPDAYGTSHDSWYRGACHDNDNIHVYAKANYKISWLDIPGDPVGTNKTMQSTVYAADC